MKLFEADFVLCDELVKSDSEPELRYTLCPILVPDTPDLQGDVITEDEIRKAVWGIQLRDNLLDLEHYLVNERLGRPVEKYVLPASTLFAKNHELLQTEACQQKLAQIAKLYQELVDMGACRLVPKGSGMLGVQWNDVAWRLIKSGQLRGLSVYGRGVRTPVEADGKSSG